MRVSVGHFEIFARDPERLARFFREALGWSAEPVSWDGPAYLKLRPPAGTEPPVRSVGGGILGDSTDQAPLLVFHLEEGTLEEALVRITAAGGSIEAPPEEIDGMGRFARFRDPDGRGYGLWEGARPEVADGAPFSQAGLPNLPMTPLVRKYLFADEAGNFDFSKNRGASQYFILTAITLEDCAAVNARFHELRHQMAWEGHDHPGPFHAAHDPAPVRDRVFAIIDQQDLKIDSIVFEKAKAMPHIRSTDERFYQHAWFFLMRYVAPLLKCDELLVVSASLGRKKKRQAFYETVQGVMRQVGQMQYRTACWEASSDSCLQVADYCSWAIQRKWESKDTAPYQGVATKIRSEYDLFALGSKFYY